MNEIKDLVKILKIENEDDMCNFEFEMHNTKYRFLISHDAFDLAMIVEAKCSCIDDGEYIETDEVPIATICVHENCLVEGKIHDDLFLKAKESSNVVRDSIDTYANIIKSAVEDIKKEFSND